MMNPNKWPLWSVAPIAAAVILMVVLIGLLIQPAVSSVSPVAEPTLINKGIIVYSSQTSTACINCHTKKDELSKVASSVTRAEQVFIDPIYLTGYHAQLGCSACHRGNGKGATFGEAHTNLVVAPSYYGEKSVEGACITCHGDISDRTINTDTPTVHDSFLDERHNDPTIDRCSSCHGQVAHGSDPFIENSHVVGIQSFCQTCHTEESREGPLNCSTCHEQVHAIPDDCSNCHSIDGWEIKAPLN